jgi:ribosome-associated toxin RatA of RatAB toxin-antitoxin module
VRCSARWRWWREPPAPQSRPAPECVACEASLEGVRDRYDEGQWSQLQEGEILTELVDAESGGEQGTARASGIIAAPAERIWGVLTDWESYSDFMPNTVETKLRRRDGDRAWISQHLRVLFNNIRYGAVWTMQPRAGLARFSLDEEEPNDIAASEGTWQLVPLRASERTLVRYESRVDVGRPVPGFIRNALSQWSLPRVLRGLRDEVEARADRRAEPEE